MTRAVATLIAGSVIAVGAASVGTAPAAQSPAADSSALLNEVRLLRQAIEQLAGNSVSQAP
jgi:hypothetical protein